MLKNMLFTLVGFAGAYCWQTSHPTWLNLIFLGWLALLVFVDVKTAPRH